jgi:hypothetical protein
MNDYDKLIMKQALEEYQAKVTNDLATKYDGDPNYTHEDEQFLIVLERRIGQLKNNLGL